MFVLPSKSQTADRAKVEVSGRMSKSSCPKVRTNDDNYSSQHRGCGDVKRHVDIEEAAKWRADGLVQLKDNDAGIGRQVGADG